MNYTLTVAPLLVRQTKRETQGGRTRWNGRRDDRLRKIVPAKSRGACPPLVDFPIFFSNYSFLQLTTNFRRTRTLHAVYFKDLSVRRIKLALDYVRIRDS